MQDLNKISERLTSTQSGVNDKDHADKNIQYYGNEQNYRNSYSAYTQNEYKKDDEGKPMPHTSLIFENYGTRL